MLAERAFPYGSFTPLTSQRTAGSTLAFAGENHVIQSLAGVDFGKTDILALSAGGAVARERSAGQGCLVINNSSAFRMQEGVPLVVPEVNPEALDRWSAEKSFRSRTAQTIQLVMVLHVLEQPARIDRVLVSTYQSASGGGRAMLNRLLSPLDPGVVAHLPMFTTYGSM